MTFARQAAFGVLLLAGLTDGGAVWAQAPAAPGRAPATPPAAAAPQTPAPAPVSTANEASRREARLLGEKLAWEPQVRGVINTVRTQVIVSLAQLNGKTGEEMIGVVDDVLMPEFVGDAAGLMASIVEAWAEAFSADELRSLRAFYNTPLGDKLLKAIPQLNERISQSGQTWAGRVFQRAAQKHTAEFTKRGLKLTP